MNIHHLFMLGEMKGINLFSYGLQSVAWKNCLFLCLHLIFFIIIVVGVYRVLDDEM